MINLENERKNLKVLIPIPNILEKVVRKRKRRWVYYFLCILLSFICSRIFLVIFSVAQFDSKNYAFNKIYYNTRKPESIYLEARHCDAFSPLNVKILEGVISLYYAVPNSSIRELMAEIHIPLLEVEKYKSLQFKGDIVWKNIRPKAIYNFRKMKNSISVHFTGNVWFRFCYIKFKKSHSEEFLLSYPFSEESTNASFFHINSIKAKNLLNSMEFKVNIDLVNLSIPTYLKICTDDVKFKFGGDIPFDLILSNQTVDAGQIRNPFTIIICIKKCNYFMYRSAIWKFINNRDIYWFLSSMSISNNDADDLETYSINIRDFINRDNFKKNEIKSTEDKQPVFYFKNINTDNNSIIGILDIDLKMFPFISRSTIFSFDLFNKTFFLKAEESQLAIFKFKLVNINEFIRINFNIEIINLNGIVDGFILKKFPVIFYDHNPIGLFAGLSFIWDGQALNFYTERNYITLYQVNSKFRSRNFLYTFNHHIDAINNEIFICSNTEFKPEESLNHSILAYFIFPRFNIKLKSKKFDGNLSIPSSNLQFLKDGYLKGILHTEFKIQLDEDIKSFEDIMIFEKDVFTFYFLESLEYVFTLESLLKFYGVDLKKFFLSNKKEKSKKLEELLIDENIQEKMKVVNTILKDISVSTSNFISFKPLRLGIKIKNISENNILKENGSVIRNIFTISKGMYLNLLVSGAEIIRGDHILLLDDAIFEVNFVNRTCKIYISDCHLGISLFSPQEIRIIFLEKIQFCHTKNVLTNIVASELNRIFDGEKVSLFQIDSSLKLFLDANSTGFKDDMITTLEMKIRLDNDILESFKFAEFNFFPGILLLKSKTMDKEILNIKIFKECNNKYCTLIIRIKLTRELWLHEDVATIYFINRNYFSKSVDIYKEDFIKIVRSFFHQLHAKEKIKDHYKAVLANLTFDTRSSFFNFDDILKIENIICSYENYGFRDLVRYKITGILGLLFNVVPNKLTLDIHAKNLDIFSLDVQPVKNINTLENIAGTTIYNLICHQKFNMLNLDKCSEDFKINELISIYEKLNELKNINKMEKLKKNVDLQQNTYGTFNEDIIDTSNDDMNENSNVNVFDKTLYPNPIPKKLLHSQGIIFPNKLLYGKMNEYALIFKANIKCNLKNKDLITVFSLEPKFTFFDSIKDLIKDDSIDVEIPSSHGFFIEKSLTGASMLLGFNVNIAFPEIFEVSGKTQDKIIVKKRLSYIKNKDGCFRISWRNLINITTISGAYNVVALGKEIDICIKVKEKYFSVCVNHKYNIHDFIFKLIFNYINPFSDFVKMNLYKSLNFLSNLPFYEFIKNFFTGDVKKNQECK